MFGLFLLLMPFANLQSTAVRIDEPGLAMASGAILILYLVG